MGEWHQRWNFVESRKNKQRTSRKEVSVPGADEGFSCLWCDCRAAQFHQTTRPGKTSCHHCDRPKGTAMNPPLAKKVQWAFDLQVEKQQEGKDKGKAKSAPTSTSGKGKDMSKDKDGGGLTEEEKDLRDTRVALLKGVTVAAKEEAPSDAMDTKEAPVSKDTALRRKIIGLYISDTPPGADSLYPPPLAKAFKAPAAVVAEALAGNAAQAFEQCKELVLKLEHNLSVIKDLGEPDLTKLAEDKLKAAQNTLEKLSKKAALSSSDPAAADAAAKAFLEATLLGRQARVTKTAALVGQASSQAAVRATKHGEDADFIKDWIKLAQNRLEILESSYLDTLTKWQELDSAQAAHEEEVLSLFDLKIAAARLAVKSDPAAAPVAVTSAVGVPPGGPTPPAPGQAAAGAVVDGESEVTAAELLAVEDYELMDDSMTAASELPVLSSTLTKEQKEGFSNLWNFLAQVFSSSELPMMPFSALQISPLFAKQLLGDKMWHGFYGPTRVVEAHDVVPRCMIGAIEVALKKVGASHTELVKNFLIDADKDKADVATIREWRQKEKTRKAKLAAEKARKSFLVKK